MVNREEENQDSVEAGKELAGVSTENLAAVQSDGRTELDAASVPMQKILVCDLSGNGYQILWTLDSQTWVRVVRQRMLNAFERDGYLARFQREQPQAEVRSIEDFYCRIPADWCEAGTRVI